MELRCRWVFLRIGRIDAIYTRTLKHYVRFNLDATQRRTRIGGKVWTSGAGTKDYHFALLHSLYCLPLIIELTYWLHADSCHDTVFLSYCAKSTAQCKRVDNCCAHSHLVAFNTVEALACTGKATENVAAAYDDTNLHTHASHVLYLLSILVETLHIYAIALLSHQTFAGELKKNTFKSHTI